MWVLKVLMDSAVEEKTFKKHGVGKEEVETALLFDEPKYFKTSKGRHSAIGFGNRFITVIFEYKKGTAEVITAYPSSEQQVRRYKAK